MQGDCDLVSALLHDCVARVVHTGHADVCSADVSCTSTVVERDVASGQSWGFLSMNCEAWVAEVARVAHVVREEVVAKERGVQQLLR